MAEFGKLYDFNVEGGIILAETSAIKESVENAFKEIFGAEFSTEASTINGRLIEAITMLFKDVLGVNAQNVNMMNVEQAIGLYLDNLGSMLGITRDEGESDYAYRRKIINGFSRGSGFAASIINAILNVNDVTRCVVLDNGMEDPAVLPVDIAGKTYKHSIAVAPHSVMISVIGGNNSDVALAIAKTKACGCGFTKTTEYGSPTESTVSIEGKTFKAIFYRPQKINTRIVVTVSSMGYHGIDIVNDARVAIKLLINSNNINSTITKPMISAALAGNGLGVIMTDCSIVVENSDVENLVIPAYKFVDLSDDNIEVTVE